MRSNLSYLLNLFYFTISYLLLSCWQQLHDILHKSIAARLVVTRVLMIKRFCKTAMNLLVAHSNFTKFIWIINENQIIIFWHAAISRVFKIRYVLQNFKSTFLLLRKCEKLVTNYCNFTSFSKLNISKILTTDNMNRVIVTDTFFILVLDRELKIIGPRNKLPFPSWISDIYRQWWVSSDVWWQR